MAKATESPSIEPGKEHLHDVATYGEEYLRNGVKSVLTRAFSLASISFDTETPDGQRIVQAWYEALVGEIPCIYWKKCSLKAIEIRPFDKFTYGQMKQAWQEMVQRGDAPGHLKN
jgi:hypothetical protein